MERPSDWYEDPKIADGASIQAVLHIQIIVPRILKGDGCDYTYFQSVCSCKWSGDYKISRIAAQEDKCPNRGMKP